LLRLNEANASAEHLNSGPEGNVGAIGNLKAINQLDLRRIRPDTRIKRTCSREFPKLLRAFKEND